MPNWKQTLQMLKPSPLFLFGLTMMSLPVGYILKRHLDWKPRPDSKKRMLIHHAVFWAACIPALKCFHNTWRYFERVPNQLPTFKPGGFWPAVAWMSASMGTLIGSFEGGGKLARYLVPKQPSSRPSPKIITSDSITYPAVAQLNQVSLAPVSNPGVSNAFHSPLYPKTALSYHVSSSFYKPTYTIPLQ